MKWFWKALIDKSEFLLFGQLSKFFFQYVTINAKGWLKICTSYLNSSRNKHLNKRSMARSITRETKREGQRKAKRWPTCKNQKKKELVLFVVERYFIHAPCNVTCMQIVKFNSNERSRTCITRQCNLLFYSRR